MVARRNQRMSQSKNCVLVALSSVTGISYQKIKQVFGRVENGGLTLHETKWILSEFGDFKQIRNKPHQSLSEWLIRHKAGRYVVVVHCFLELHAIAVIDGEIDEGVWPRYHNNIIVKVFKFL